MALGSLALSCYGPILSDTTSQAAVLIDSVYSFDSSGDCIGVRFVCPQTLSTENLRVFFYCTAITGTVTDLFQLEIREGTPNGSADDNDNPRKTGGSVIASSATATPSANSWTQFDCSSISLSAGTSYFFIVKGLTGVDGSNNATFITRSAASAFPDELVTSFRGFSDTAGFSGGGPTVSANCTAAVFVFDQGGAGETHYGNPYVNVSSPAVTGYRGNRVTINEDVEIKGVNWGGSTSGSWDFSIHNGATEILRIASLDDAILSIMSHVMFDPVTLEKGKTYDITLNLGSSSSYIARFDMGSGTIPADVKSCAPNGDWAEVTGTTPGSLTIDDEKIANMLLILHDTPVIASSGGETSHTFAC